MHHLNTFNIPKGEGASEVAGGRRNQETTKCHEIKGKGISSNTSLENAKEMGILLLPSITI